ncbi:acyltransferase family protein [Rothia nasimurium]|uniref:acyltransferase family protein n=1 Tax=Rothia nasimurium TaxID=85336 RepID=UPI001F24F3B1|nr:acyltransferase [Rothia nasimurium]
MMSSQQKTSAPSLHHSSGAQYWPQLDGMRTIAVLLVILGHAWTRHFYGATVGVGLFFALSGFLITGLLLNEREKYGSINLIKFSGRRLLRLVPALILMLVVTVPLLTPPVAEIFSALLYYSNWVRVSGNDMGAYGHLWSLAVEEQFYLFWPLLLVAAYAFKKVKGVAVTALVLIAGSTAIKFIYASSEDRIYNGLDARMDNLLVGALLAIAYRYWPETVKGWSRILAIPGLIIIGFMTFAPQFVAMPVELTLITWGSVMVVALLACGEISWINSFMSWKPLVWFGAISYGVYLWHYPIQFLWLTQGIGYSLRFPLVLVTTTIIAWLSYKFVERPLSKALRPYVSVH